METTTRHANENLISILFHLKRGIFKLAENEGLTAVQFFMLDRLSREGELVMGQLADGLHCDPSNVTGIVDRLVAQDLVTRSECSRDRRAKTLHLTPKGQKKMDTLLESLPAALGFDKLTEQERDTLYNLLQKACK